MAIVGGLDVHRQQITFDYLDTDTGEVSTGQVPAADRRQVAACLQRRFGHRDDRSQIEFSVEGRTGWRYVAEELAAAGTVAHLAEPAETANLRGRKKRAKTAVAAVGRRSAPAGVVGAAPGESVISCAAKKWLGKRRQGDMRRPDWAPADVDVDAASPARVYDALLGGSHNFEVDRQAARWGIEAVPDLPAAALANRHFLRRAVTYLAESGITQFIDLGAGIPTVGNTHEVAQRCNPECRVAYVDIDAVAIAHASAILAGNDRAIAVRGDLRAPSAVLADPALTTFIDLSKPVAVLLVAVVHLLTDEDDAPAAVAALRDETAPGSHLVITSLTSSHRPGDATRLTGVAQRDRISLIPRPRTWIESLFGDFTVLPPGLVPVADWRREPDPGEEAGRGTALILGAVGRKG